MNTLLVFHRRFTVFNYIKINPSNLKIFFAITIFPVTLLKGNSFKTGTTQVPCKSL